MSRLDEKRFTAGGREWIARFDFNAQCAIEEDSGKAFWAFVSPLLVQLDEKDAQDPAKILAAMTALRKSDVRLLLFHALAGQHEGLALEDVGDLIQEIGFGAAMEIAVWALAQAMPSAPDDEEEGGATSTANPSTSRTVRKSAAKRG